MKTTKLINYVFLIISFISIPFGINVITGQYFDNKIIIMIYIISSFICSCFTYGYFFSKLLLKKGKTK